jgi:hypothetical protein
MTYPSESLFPSEDLYPSDGSVTPSNNTFYITDLTDDWATLKGAARILTNDINSSVPEKISDIIDLVDFDAINGWKDLGVTKGGVTISRNHTEESLSVDQVFGDIYSDPTSWTIEVQTALAEMTLEHLRFAWEGSEIFTNSSGERVLGYGQSENYTKRRLAVFYRSPKTKKIRAYIFYITQISPTESSIVFNKEGDQMTIPIVIKAFPDTDVVDPKAKFGFVLEQ